MLANPMTTQSSHATDWPKSRKIIFVICLALFLYQLYKITAQYYRYETRYDTHFADDKRALDLPAITLCTPRHVEFLKSTLKKKYPHIYDRISAIERSNGTKEYKEEVIANIYEYYTRWTQSPKMYFDKTVRHTDIAECYVTEPTVWMKQNNWNLKVSDCSSLSPVLDSRVSRYGKCFTYLSRQQHQIKGLTDLQMDANHNEQPLIELILILDDFADAINVWNSHTEEAVYMFIHDAYRMPSFQEEDAIKMNNHMSYDIRYWSTSKIKLTHPYSDCYPYRKNLMSSSPSSRDQCVRQCFIDKSANIFNCIVPHHSMVNDDKLKSSSLGHCQSMKELMLSKNIEKQCMNSCHKECHRSEYKFDVSVKGYSWGDRAQTPKLRTVNKFSTVSVRPKREEDMEYREVPVQSMCSTVHQMLIALLIWFGLSIFSFSSVFESAVTLSRPHLYSITTFEDRVSPNITMETNQQKSANTGLTAGPLMPVMNEPMIRPKFNPTNIGSNVKLEHYNEFISKVVDGYPNAQVVDMPSKKTQY